MKAVVGHNGNTVLIPEGDVSLEYLAVVDSAEWITIGLLGSANQLLLDGDEWPEFVRFVNQIDEYRRSK